MADNKTYITATDETFDSEVIKSDQPVLVDFWAPWCGPCRVLGPVVEELADEFEGRAKVVKVNVDDSPQVAQRFGIRSIPTLLFFQGGEVVDTKVGVTAKHDLAAKLTTLAPAAA